MFWLRNTDASAEFVYWTSADAERPQPQLLAALPRAPGGAHRVAPGERVSIRVPEALTVVAAFVPWSLPAGYLTSVNGGYLLRAELPLRGTLQVDRAAFAAANRGRALAAPLQAWGLVPNRFHLDGNADEWADLPPLAEWGNAFRPGAAPWPSGWPRPRTLQAADREGALWIHLVTEPGGLPVGTSVSLALRRPGAFLEWPLSGRDATVWSWVEGADAAPAGYLVVKGSELEAWVPWDRLPEPERRAWKSAPLTWSLIVTQAGTPRVLDLASTAWAEWP